MSTKIVRVLLLSFTIILIFLWTESSALNPYNLQLTGALILLYFASRFLFRSIKQSFFVATLVLVSIVLLLIFSTGGIVSPIFFVLNFLLFAIALLLAPYQATVASFLLIIIFLWQNYTNFTSTVIIELLSLILMTPLAVIFSNSYLKYLQSEGKITLLKEELKDEQSDSLLWIATTAKPSLASILNSITDIVMYLNTKSQTTQIPKLLLSKLKTIQQDLISLYSSTGTLEKSIEESSDKIKL
jgi:signal transduction histidine kinase